MLTLPQERWTRPSSIPPLQWIVSAELLEQPTLHVPPHELLVGTFRTGRGPLPWSSSEAGFWIDQRSDLRDDLDRDCITISQVRRVIS